MSVVEIKANSTALDTYYANLDALKKNLKLSSEGSTRRAFGRLLEDTSSVRKWTLAEEVTVRKKNHRIRLDGILYGKGSLPRGYWEAKDESDDLSAEILKKRAKEYPVNNIIFEDTDHAILIQDNVEVMEIEVTNRDDLARLLSRFYNYEMEPFEEFDKAVEWFADIIPDIGRDLTEKITESHKTNKNFQREFDEFMELCRSSLNPNISKDAVDEMLIQHLLTERLIRNIFQSDFTQRNVIAKKVEDVISALTQPLFDRSEFQQSLDSFYTVIENAAESLAEDYQAKQTFINTVYEQFFQGYSVKTADTHGIVYTPQEIVDFMCAAVEEVLEDEFGKKLGQDGVAVLDPATGTGNFIINLLNRVNPKYRRDFYKHHLFANEVMLMPYYIASLNIEHEYYALEGEYEPFEGLAFVDTLDLAKKKQLSFDFMTEKNSARVKRQQETDITVIIGNPPYNVGQVNENDNNKNRAYEVVDKRIKETYVKDSKATLNMAVYDAYVKFFRWATDRLNDNDGIVCYVTNNNFVDGYAFDGMRKHLLEDFNRVYHLDLGGNARKGGGGNVFDIMVGVGITIAIRKEAFSDKKLFYHTLSNTWHKNKKLDFLKWNVREDGTANSLNTVSWQELKPNEKNTWIISENLEEFEVFLPIGSKEDKRARYGEAEAIFKSYSSGVKTNADYYVYDFSEQSQIEKAKDIIEDYQSQLGRWKISKKTQNPSEFLNIDETIHKWVRKTKRYLKRELPAEFNPSDIRTALYRPFTKRYQFFNRMFNEEIYRFESIVPSAKQELENQVIVVPGIGNRKEYGCMISQHITNLDFAFEKVQCFPFYVYDEDGSNRRENITDWALKQFQSHYDDPSITKWDIFYYVYGLLHHPAYRERYADNLKRELPRIPFVPKSPLRSGGDLEGDEQVAFNISPPPSPLPASQRGGTDEADSASQRGGLKSPLQSGGDLEGDEKVISSTNDNLEGHSNVIMTRTTADIWEKLKPFARFMRQEPTPAEDKLWQRLRKKQLAGLRFRRQHPIGNFIADFYCASARLVVEVDGSIHDLPDQQDYDALRQAYIESLGLRVIRFSNGDVMNNIDGVLERIAEEISPPPSPLPDAQGGGMKSPLRSGGDLEGEVSPPPNPLPDAQGGGTDEADSAWQGGGLKSPLQSGGDLEGDNGFWIFSRAGKDLAESHLNYENGKRYEGIQWETNSDMKPSYRVEKMLPRKKRDAEDGNYKVYDTLKVNEYLTLTGIPEEAFAYRLGNRSALDWIVDQYRVKTDKRSGITSDPNGYSDDEQYIVQLVERVVQVSVDTVAIVNRLAELDFRTEE